MTKKEFKNVPVTKETKDNLDDIGRFQESYDDLIKRLITVYRETQPMVRKV